MTLLHSYNVWKLWWHPQSWVTVECQLSKLQTSEHVSQPNGLPILINAHIPWRQLHEKTALIYMCVFCRARLLVVWLFQVLLFCRHLFFICDPACAVVLRMSSVTPQKRKHCVLSIKLQTYGIFIKLGGSLLHSIRGTEVTNHVTWNHK